MRSVSSTVALLRRIRAERGTLLLLFLLVVVTSFLAAAAPRMFDRTADAGLRYEIAAATAIGRNLEFTAAGRIPSQEGDPFARVRARGDELWDQLPAAVREIVADRGFLVETPRFMLADPPNYTTMVTLAYQEGVEERLTMVDGRLPARATQAPEADAPPRLEIALSTAAADTTKLAVGDRMLATVDGGDPLLRRLFPRPTTQVELDVVGLYEIDPGDPFWFDDTRLGAASVGGTEEFPIAYATALFAPAAYRDVRATNLPALHHWRFLTDTSRIDAARLGALVPALRRLETMFGTTTGTPGQVVYRSGLLGLVDRFDALRSVSGATLSVAALGPLAVAAGAVGMVALVIVRRRRAPLLLARGRGASAGQLLGAQAVEGLLVTVPACLVGLLAATIAIPRPTGATSSAGALAVALVATALTVVATWPLARRARRDLERADAPGRRAGARRLVFEATVVGLAVAATWLLRERSLAGSAASAVTAEPGVDPFLAAAPVLRAIAVGLAAIRLYPIPVRALSALAARRRDLVPVLGLRTVGRNPSAAHLPLLVLTLTVAIGVFSSVIQVTIERGQLETSWQSIGADYRVEVPLGGALADDLDLAGVEGIAVVAPAFTVLASPGGSSGVRTPTLLQAVDPPAYEAVVSGTPADVTLPAELVAAPTGPRIGTSEDPIPVLASARPTAGGLARTVGEVFSLQLRGRPVWFRVVALADTFPGIVPNVTFAVAPLASLAAANGGTGLRPNLAFASGPPDAAPGLEAALAGTVTADRLVSRHARYAALHDAPLVGAVGAGFGIALGIAAAYAALTVVAVLALDSQRRYRELAYLRTLGLTDRQLVGLTVVEHGPPVAVALVVGLGLGLVVAWLLAPGLELAVFIEPTAPVVLRVDTVAVVAVLALTILVVVVAVAGSSWLARRLDAAEALRMGDA